MYAMEIPGGVKTVYKTKQCTFIGSRDMYVHLLRILWLLDK